MPTISLLWVRKGNGGHTLRGSIVLPAKNVSAFPSVGYAEKLVYQEMLRLDGSFISRFDSGSAALDFVAFQGGILP